MREDEIIIDDFGGNIVIDVDEELSLLLKDMENYKTGLEEKHTSSFLDECKHSIVDSIIGPFGLSAVMFNDKDGGGVTTLHNAEKSIFANNKDENRYNRAYDSKAYHNKNVNYNDTHKEIHKEINSKGYVSDKYTGQKLGKEDYNLEHFSASNNVFQKGKLFADDKKLSNIANSKENLGAIEKGMNKSKRDFDFDEWGNKTNTKDPSKNNFEGYGVTEKGKEVNSNAEKSINYKINVEKAKYYTLSMAKDGLKQGALMGARASIGVILKEFVDELFQAIKIIFKEKLGLKEIFNKIIECIKNTWKRVCEKWKDIVSAFFTGGASGFLSSILTTIINLFLTTAKRIVRLIREGFYAIVKIIKLMINPPKDMPNEEIFFQISKIGASALMIAVGIGIEEILERSIQTIPILIPLAPLIATVVSGIFTGIGTVMILYAMDKFKDKMTFSNKGIIHAQQGVLANQYRVIQTVIMLENEAKRSIESRIAIKEKNKILDEQLDEMEMLMSEFENSY